MLQKSYDTILGTFVTNNCDYEPFAIKLFMVVINIVSCRQSCE